MSTRHCFPIYLATVWLGRYNDSVNFPPLLHITSHTHTHSHSLYQFAFVSISVCCADGSTNSVSLVRSSQLLSHCQVKSLNLQGTTTAVLNSVVCYSHTLSTAFPRSTPTTGFEQVRSQSESLFVLCVCVCVCVVTTAFPLPRLSTWKVQRQFQLV